MKKNGYFVSQVGFDFIPETPEIKTLDYFFQLSNTKLIIEINGKLKGTDTLLAAGILRNILNKSKKLLGLYFRAINP